MKILIVNNNQFGYHLDTYKYCECLSADNDVTYICFDFGFDKFESNKINVIYVKRDAYFISRVYLFFKSILDLIKINNYDVIFVKHFKFCFPIALMNKNVILDIRTSSVNKSKYKRFLEDSILKFDSLFYKKITVISESVAKRLNVKFDCILPLGADSFGKLDNTDYKNGFNLVYIGTYTGRNLHEFIKGLSIYINSGGVVNSMYIIGHGSKEDYDLINREVFSNGLNEVVKLTGFLNHKESYEYIKKANVGVAYVPITPFYDKQPVTKTIEYLATGLPVLATATLGNSIYINNSNGVLVGDNPKSVCQGLKDFMCLSFDNSTFELNFNSWDIVSEKLYHFMESVKHEIR
ncbi:glycosyltransferase [Shewanella sp. MF05960]|uniref:glycosyltransferase n=1 Tax=Shewanella sp. MF05960 TaxID=3434874 RepID=UPI003D7AADD8